MMSWQDENADGKVDFSGWRKPRMILAYSQDAKPRPLRWLWPGQIPFGALTFFDGDEGWLGSPAIDLIARATNGGNLPGGSLGVGGPVLLMGEFEYPDDDVDEEAIDEEVDDEEAIDEEVDDEEVDDEEVDDEEAIDEEAIDEEDIDEAMEAILTAVHVDRRFITVSPGIPWWDSGSQRVLYDMCDLPDGAHRLEAMVCEKDYTLMVIDHMGLYLDMFLWQPTYHTLLHKLTPLARLAAMRNLVVLILRCPDVAFPVPSGGWGSANFPRRRCPRIRWVGDSKFTEYERIVAEYHFGWYERERLDIWLRNELSAGPVPAKELEWLAAGQGWTPKQLRSAGKRLGVIAQRQGFGPNGYSLWSLRWK